jgi:hypothetical protein
MNKFFRELDLYKGIVLAAVLLIPIGLWLVSAQKERIVACTRAIDDAKRAGGLLEEIGSLQRKVEIVVQNKRGMSDAIEKPTTYLEGQIIAAGGSALKSSDFVLQSPKVDPGTLPGSKQAVNDHVLDVLWPRKELSVPMDFLYAVLFNCESGAGIAAGQGQQSVWKLRTLEVLNATDERLMQASKTPPAELQDKWTIRRMSFVRREPAQAKGK